MRVLTHAAVNTIILYFFIVICTAILETSCRVFCSLQRCASDLIRFSTSFCPKEGSFSMMRMECLWLRCIGSTDLIVWLAGTMISIGCRCQTSPHMYADTPIARIWQNQEWTRRRYSTSWDIQIYRLQ